MPESGPNADMVGMTARIVSAHISHNPVANDALPGLIQEVYRALCGVNAPPPPAPDRPQPAVPPRRSVFPDYIVCLEDGKKLKTLKRHLQSAFGLTPEQYRERWGLDSDYPMVAPSYAKHRSALARQIGLGTRPRR